MAIDKNSVTKDAQKFAAKGQYDKAIAEWKKLLRESPNDANLYNTIGDLCLKKDAKSDAVDAYKRAADILAEDGFTSKAIALYKKVLNIDPNKVEVHLILGDLNADKGLTGNALASYKVAADYYMQQKDTAKGLGIYQKMADLNPTNLAFRIKMGDMYGKEGMIEQATQAYLDAADVHISQNAFTDARQLFEKVLTLDPNNRAVYYKAGVVYLKEGKFGDACKALKPAFEKAPGNPEVAETYLDALGKAGRKTEAESVMKAILAEDPDRTAVRRALYRQYLGAGEHQKALDEALILVHGYMEHDEHENAEETLLNFVADAPHFAPGRQKLGEYYVSARRRPDAAAAFLQCAELFADQGEREAAIAAVHRALDNAPDLQDAANLLDRLTAPVGAPSSEPELEPLPEAVSTTLEHLSDAVPFMAEEPEAPEQKPEEAAYPHLDEQLPEFAVPEEPAQPEAQETGIPEPEPYFPEPAPEPTPEQELPYQESAPEPVEQQTPVSQEAGEFEIPPAGSALPETAFELPGAEEYIPPAAEIQSESALTEIPEAASPPDEIRTVSHPGEPIDTSPGEEASAELPQEPEEDPAIRAACIEIDVLTKYGLITKAIEQLENLALRFPESILVRVKLRDLYGDQGSMKKAVHHMLILAKLYEKTGQSGNAIATLQSAYELDPNNPEIIRKLGLEPEEPAAPPQPERYAVSVEYVPPAPEPGTPAAATSFPPTEEVPDDRSAFPDVGPAENETDAFAHFESALFDRPAEAGEGFPEADIAGQEPVPAEPEEPAGEEASAAITTEGHGPEAVQDRAAAPEADSSAGKINISEIWAEAEFYFQQGLFDEAKKCYEKILTMKPGASLAIARLAELSREAEDTREFSKLAESIEGLEGVYTEGAAGELPMTDTDESAVRTLMSEIAQLSPHTEPPAADASPEEILPPSPETPEEPSFSAPEEPAPHRIRDKFEKKPLAPLQQAADELAARTKPKPPPVVEQPLSAFAKHGEPPEEAIIEGVDVRSEEAKPDEEDYIDLGAELAAENETPAPGPAGASEEYFDLAAELRDELSSAPSTTGSAPAAEQSLDEIFEDFKRGVEMKSTREDADTHYNLGVAYKEMGLLDDAIAEFAMTPEDQSKFIQSRYMLGLCYLEKGEYRGAIGEIQNALDYSDTLGDGTLDPIGMHYDLGLAHQGAGNVSEALREFQTVYGADQHYLDVVAKIRELRQGRAVSAARLKNDIDKEISSKFLREGERIEREEKHKKSEKIKH